MASETEKAPGKSRGALNITNIISAAIAAASLLWGVWQSTRDRTPQTLGEIAEALKSIAGAAGKVGEIPEGQEELARQVFTGAGEIGRQIVAKAEPGVIAVGGVQVFEERLPVKLGDSVVVLTGDGQRVNIALRDFYSTGVSVVVVNGIAQNYQVGARLFQPSPESCFVELASRDEETKSILVTAACP